MHDVTIFDKIRVGIASPEDVLGWSHGEIKKPETINYRTFKPERDGLFCERIFGPVKDWECACGRYKKIKYKGIVCERCGVEVTRSRVRRERMGHIELAAPVCHIWFLKGVPSPMALLLNIGPRDLEKVVYFGAFIVIELDKEQIEANRAEIFDSVEEEKVAIKAQMQELEEEIRSHFAKELEQNKEEYDEATIKDRTKAINDRIKAEQRDAIDREKEMDVALEVLEKLEVHSLIEEDKYRAVDRMLDAVTRRTKKNYRAMLKAGIGANAVKELLDGVELEIQSGELKETIMKSTGPKRARAIKRQEIIDAFIRSKTKPNWMVLDVLPVISPELRPMVQLDGGRFATSDLNDLYRRIINRNNRLRKIIEIRAPESIINHEKRLLQEAVDALIDNGRRARPVVGSNNRALKSLSDMLKGKEGRFRKNLLGKRVDYSGRAVIVVGPHLKLHQCGLPKEMALELFKPYVMKALVDHKLTQNIKTAKRMIDRMHPAVWDALEEVIKDHPVLLNRAPTLHRFGIQAFEPILVDGKAIQIHPLVCNGFNADFDGDQMAVHVPLSAAAQAEARILILSANNLFSPADGGPTMTPHQDVVLGAYALTKQNPEGRQRLDALKAAFQKDPKNNPAPFTCASPEEAILLCNHPDASTRISRNDPIAVRLKRPIGKPDENGEQEHEYIVREMTPGQLIFHEIIPFPLKYSDAWVNVEMTKRNLGRLITEVRNVTSSQTTVDFLDKLKELGFEWATRYGLTMSLSDVNPETAPESDQSRVATLAKHRYGGVKLGEGVPWGIPAHKEGEHSKLTNLIQDEIGTAKDATRDVRANYERGKIARNERDRVLQRIWGTAFKDLSDGIMIEMGPFNPLRMMVESGARGSREQLVQLMATRGMFRNNFNQPITDIVGGAGLFMGSRVFEYFVSMFGTRKGVTDTALLMGYSGFIARRLVDVSHDVVIKAEDCGTTSGVYISRIVSEGEMIENFRLRARGRTSVETLLDPREKDKRVIVEAQADIDDTACGTLAGVDDEYYKRRKDAQEAADPQKAIQKLEDEFTKCGFRIGDHGELLVTIRSPLTCDLDRGICAKCYGWDLSTSKLVEVGTAVGVIAAETMSEPLSQLTMRTFHHGGVATGTVLTGYNQAGRMYGSLHQELKADMAAEEQELTQLPDFVGEQRKLVDQLTGKAAAEAGEAPKEGAKPKKAETPSSKTTANKQLARELVEHSFYHYVGIPFVERLLEARRAPKGEAVISRFHGKIDKIETGRLGRWVAIRAELAIDSSELSGRTVAEDLRHSTKKDVIVSAGTDLNRALIEKLMKGGIKNVPILDLVLLPKRRLLLVKEGDAVAAGDPLTQGPLNLDLLLEFRGIRAVQEYMIKELQTLYKSNGVSINDRHLEIICRQMMRKVKIRDAGDTGFLPGQVVDRFVFRRQNERITDLNSRGEKLSYTNEESGETVTRPYAPATADAIIQGITEAALTTDSFLSAASAQKTVRILTEAAVRGKVDELIGLKENVIIGRLIPAGSGFPSYRTIQVKTTREPVWAKASLTALASMQDSEEVEDFEESEDIGDIKSLAESLGAETATEEFPH